MIDFFLRSKHWTIFLLLFGLPILVEVIFIGWIFNSTGIESGLFTFDQLYSIIPWITLLSMGAWLGWFWSIGYGLQEKIPTRLRMKTSRLAFTAVFPLLYGSLFSLVLFPGFASVNLTQITDHGLGWLAIIMPLHLLAMFCLFYNFYFAAKTIKLAELRRPVSFGDYAGEFFLLWYFPIRIWWLQPKVNRLHEDDNYGMSEILDYQL